MTGAPEPGPDRDPWSYDTRVPEGAAPAGPKQLQVGTLFAGRFQVRGRIGRGGMGTVYRALEQSSGREVALKLLSRDLSAKARERFRREGELTAALRHPGIVGIHAAGDADGIPYLAYELVQSGRTLRDALEGLSRVEFVTLLRQVAEAVGHAHAAGIVHRDLKPENVLIDEQGRPRVADFGLAREAGQERLTQTGALVGTPYYMAPEQILGDREELGPATDVWALGVVLYEGLTGQLPFSGESMIALSAQVTHEPPLAPREVNQDVSPALEAVCLAALHKEPGRRYPHASALAADLDSALSGRPLSGVAGSSALRSARGGDRLAALGLAVVGVLAVLVAGGWLLNAGRADDPPLPPRTTPAVSPLDRAHADLAHERFAEAAAAYEEAAADGKQVLRWRGLALIGAGRVDDAERLSRDALALDLADLEAQALQVRVALARGDQAAARAGWERFCEQDSGPRASLLEAELARAVGDDPLPLLRAGLLQRPASSELRAAIAAQLVERGRLWPAWRTLSPGASEDPRQALLRDVLDEVCAAPPRVEVTQGAPPRLQRHVVRWLLAEAQREVALVLRARDPRSAAPSAAATAADERQRRARAILAAALRLNEGLADPEATGLAHRLLAELEPPGAPARGEHARAALSALPDDAGAVCLEAQVCLEEGRFAEALARVDGVRHPRAVWVRALALLAEGADDAPRLLLEALPADDLLRHEEALRVARRCEHHELAATLEGRVSLLRGDRREEADALAIEASRESSRPERSATVTLRLYERALEAYPLHVTALYRMGQKVYLLGDAQAGLASSLTALERDPRLIADFYGTLQLIAVAQSQLGGSNLAKLYQEAPGGTFQARRVRAFLACSLAEFEEQAEWVPRALVELDALLAEDPGQIWAYVFRAALQIRAGAPLLAERDLWIAEGAAPDCSSVHFFRALLAATRGEGTQAVVGPLTQAQELGFRFSKGGKQLLARYPAFSDYLERPELRPFLETPR